MKTRPASPVGVLFVAAAAAACTVYTVPVEHVMNARSAIQSAEGAGAASSQHGRLYLTTAQSELDQAMRSSGKDADLLLLRSQVDAELALVLARKDALERQAAEAAHRAQTLAASQARP
jgi:hypothetical protein